jgi:hypothetical protein
MADAEGGRTIPGNAQHVPVQPVGEAAVRRFQSGFTAPQRIAVHDTSTWTGLWAQIEAAVTPVPPVPAIDFTTTTVIIAAMGTHASGGFSIRVDDAATLDGDAWISVVEQSPGVHCVVPAVVTSPVVVVAIPRFDGSTTFVEHTEATSCE